MLEIFGEIVILVIAFDHWIDRDIEVKFLSSQGVLPRHLSSVGVVDLKRVRLR